MYHLHTDGSELTHASCGGWGYILTSNEGEIRCNGFRWQLGTNQMELIAVLQGLDSLTEPSKVLVYTDSNYVIVNARKRKNNPEPLLAELYLLLAFHKVKFRKIPGKLNKAHHLAREAMFNAICVHREQGHSYDLHRHNLRRWESVREDKVRQGANASPLQVA